MKRFQLFFLISVILHSVSNSYAWVYKYSESMEPSSLYDSRTGQGWNSLREVIPNHYPTSWYGYWRVFSEADSAENNYQSTSSYATLLDKRWKDVYIYLIGYSSYSQFCAQNIWWQWNAHTFYDNSSSKAWIEFDGHCAGQGFHDGGSVFYGDHEGTFSHGGWIQESVGDSTVYLTNTTTSATPNWQHTSQYDGYWNLSDGNGFGNNYTLNVSNVNKAYTEVLVAWAGSFSQCENDAYATSFMDADTERPGPGSEPPSQPTTTEFFLTFDDGPRGGTDDCIRITNNNDVKATFFMVGVHMDTPTYEEYVRAAYNSNHLIGNHSYDHWHLSSDYNNRTPQQYVTNFNSNDSRISQILGVSSQKFMYSRMPGKNSWRVRNISVDDGTNAILHANAIHNNGYDIFGWDTEWPMDSNNLPTKSVEEMLAIIYNKIDNQGSLKTQGKIILLTHDRMFSQSGGYDDDLDRFLKGLKNNAGTKYEINFKKISEY